MFYDRLVELCKNENKKITPVIRELGLSTGGIARWRNGSIPDGNTLYKIADYFNVSVDYLLGKTDKKEKPSAKSEEQNAVFLDDKKIYMLPIYESVDYLPCYITNQSEAEESLCIKVKGDSMYPKIEDGDIIQVHKQTSVDSGSIAVLLIDGEEGVVKRVVYGDDWIELHSINPTYPVLRYEGADVLRLQVVGLVKKIIKDV